jgi:hypothetical protein
MKRIITADKVQEVVLAALTSAENQSHENARATEVAVSPGIYWAAFEREEFRECVGGVLQPYVRIHGYKCKIDLKLKGEAAALVAV